ncbi:hypothetical protein DFH09DRAFT_1438049 [Mycena vulgaris]|nr:hypothetical protein DFH09DRAFT_1438049 [Mycena vulgaris]
MPHGGKEAVLFKTILTEDEGAGVRIGADSSRHSSKELSASGAGLEALLPPEIPGVCVCSDPRRPKNTYSARAINLMPVNLRRFTPKPAVTVTVELFPDPLTVRPLEPKAKKPHRKTLSGQKPHAAFAQPLYYGDLNAYFVRSSKIKIWIIFYVPASNVPGTPGVPQIAFEELNRRIYHACILHDLSWTNTTEGLDHPAHAMSFEFHGGIMAYDHLHAAAPALDAIQVGDIVQSIFLHTSQWASGTSSATGMPMYLSAFFDVDDRKTVQEIEKHYPRADFGNQTIEVLDGELDKKSNCLISHLPGGMKRFRDKWGLSKGGEEAMVLRIYWPDLNGTCRSKNVASHQRASF